LARYFLQHGLQQPEAIGSAIVSPSALLSQNLSGDRASVANSKRKPVVVLGFSVRLYGIAGIVKPSRDAASKANSRLLWAKYRETGEASDPVSVQWMNRTEHSLYYMGTCLVRFQNDPGGAWIGS
jgi:hypothetical protein